MPDFTPRTRNSGKLSASAWNAMTQLVRREGQLPGEGDDVLGYGLQSNLQALIRNDTGGDLAEMSIVRLGDPLVDPAVLPLDFLSRPIFKGLKPVGPADTFAVLREAIADGEVGVAIFGGLAVCKVIDAGVSPAYRWAVPVKDTTDRLTAVAAPTGTQVFYQSPSNIGSVVAIGPTQEISLWMLLTSSPSSGEYSWSEYDPLTNASGIGRTGGAGNFPVREAYSDRAGGPGDNDDHKGEVVYATFHPLHACYYFRSHRISEESGSWMHDGGLDAYPASSADARGAHMGIAFDGTHLYVKDGSWLKLPTAFTTF